MQKIKQYTTIKGFSEFIFKEKNSEFIAQAYPAESEEDTQKLLTDARKKYFDAKHHCYAVRLINNNFIKYSDDGEPGGSAGIRILNAIEHFDLYNVTVIVTRYFGGTKLGVGPLGKAYYKSAETVLNQSEKIVKEAFYKILIEVDFSLVSHTHRIFSQNDVKILGTKYKENIQFEILVKTEKLEYLINLLSETSKGSIIVKTVEKTLFFETLE